mmetsp:Transcript_44206/g.60375  ORF Transcript_44206/g.60375 Transcript_44206/m.60375 type:complete len:143 (+) Transcript_44206:1395-1823(+)
MARIPIRKKGKSRPAKGTVPPHTRILPVTPESADHQSDHRYVTTRTTPKGSSVGQTIRKGLTKARPHLMSLEAGRIHRLISLAARCHRRRMEITIDLRQVTTAATATATATTTVNTPNEVHDACPHLLSTTGTTDAADRENQ